MTNLLEAYRAWSIVAVILTILFMFFWFWSLSDVTQTGQARDGAGWAIIFYFILLYVPTLGISFFCFLLIGLFSSGRLYFLSKTRWILHLTTILTTGVLLVTLILSVVSNYKHRQQDLLDREENKIRIQQRELRRKQLD